MSKLAPDASAVLVQSLDELLDMRAWLGERRDWLGCDIETTGFNLGRDTTRLFQIGDEQRGWALPWGDWAGAVRELVPAYRGRVVFHNSTFDLAFLRRDGVVIDERLVHDTMIMAHLVDSGRPIGLKPAAARRVGGEALMGKNALTEAFHAGGWDYATIPVDHPAYWQYGCLDTMLTAALADEYWPEMGPYREVYEVELACIHVLLGARIRGLHVDLDYCERTRAQLLADVEGIRARLAPLDPGKDAQVKDLLTRSGRERGYGESLAEWWPFRTDNGEVSIDDDALEAFEDRFPALIPPLREYRTKSRMVSNYLEALLRTNVDGVVRCNIKQVGARTGRMSITEPPLQTLPRGRLIRDAFVAPEGHRLLLADYSQMEARMLASYAGEQAMIDTFLRGDDLHTWTAGAVYHGGLEHLVQKIQRQIAKNVGYANMYGAGIPKIAATAGAPVADVEAFMERYNALFPGISRFKQQVIDVVGHRNRDEGQGYVKTILGRKLAVERDKAFKGVNYTIQGGGADVLKRKIIELDAAGMGEFLRLPVHDEVISIVPDDCIEEARRIVERVMPERDLFSCPLDIETDVCARWGEHYEEDDARRGHWAAGCWEPAAVSLAA